MWARRADFDQHEQARFIPTTRRHDQAPPQHIMMTSQPTSNTQRNKHNTTNTRPINMTSKVTSRDAYHTINQIDMPYSISHLPHTPQTYPIVMEWIISSGSIITSCQHKMSCCVMLCHVMPSTCSLQSQTDTSHRRPQHDPADDPDMLTLQHTMVYTPIDCSQHTQHTHTYPTGS